MQNTVIEWFSGLGGFAAAFPQLSTIAIDVNRNGLDTFQLNFQSTDLTQFAKIEEPDSIRHWHGCLNINSVSFERFDPFPVDGWWMSPPCQPFTRRGNQKDNDDPRTQPFLRLVRQIPLAMPNWIALENVPDFEHSNCHRLLLDQLKQQDYSLTEARLCPTQFGFPNRRLRYYLVASRQRQLPEEFAHPASDSTMPIQGFLQSDPEPGLRVPAELIQRYRGAIHLIDREQRDEIANCFTSAYGTSPVRSGSYLLESDEVRRFSPSEILRLLGFPESFAFPAQLSNRQQWKLIGNSIHVVVVQQLLNSTLFSVGTESE